MDWLALKREFSLPEFESPISNGGQRWFLFKTFVLGMQMVIFRHLHVVFSGCALPSSFSFQPRASAPSCILSPFYVFAQAGLELVKLWPQPPRMLELHACTTTLDFTFTSYRDAGDVM